jgi:hypothetical protein
MVFSAPIWKPDPVVPAQAHGRRRVNDLPFETPPRKSAVAGLRKHGADLG